MLNAGAAPGGHYAPIAGVPFSQKPGLWLASTAGATGASPMSKAALPNRAVVLVGTAGQDEWQRCGTQLWLGLLPGSLLLHILLHPLENVGLLVEA